MYKNKFIVLFAFFVSLLTGCNEKPKFSADLNGFFSIDKNVTYVYKIVDMHRMNDKPEEWTHETYMERKITQAGENCIDIRSYVVFSDNDIERMDKRLKAQLKNRKLKALDEKYCVVGNTRITINGETYVDLEKEWTIRSESIPVNDSKPATHRLKCKVENISNETLLHRSRKVIHTRCTANTSVTVDWFFAEKIGLYTLEMTADFPQFHSQSKNRIVLIGEK
jgi:hypothetical protein